ncbi:MAG: DUF3857 domain-containing protein [Marinifilaceae bacterium]
MKRIVGIKILLLLCIITICGVSNAQNKKVKFGKIPKEDLASKVCKMDSSAYAEVLYERGDLRISVENNTYVRNLKVFRRVKIYNKKAYHYANVDVSYNKIDSRLVQIKACTYNLINGKVVKTKLRSRDILIENLIGSMRKKKFAFKDVKEGCIIEYQYSLTTPLRTSLINWKFQDEIPVRRNDLKVRIPEKFKFKENLTGYEDVSRHLTLSPYQNQLTNIYSYNAANLPAFRKEAFIDCREDYISKIEFELSSISFDNGGYKSFSSDWNSICESLEEDLHFGVVFKNRAFFKDILNTLELDSLDNDAKARKIFSYIRDNYKWNKYYNYSSNENLRKIYKDKTGNSAALNLLMIALMRTAGFECSPVILSTKFNGRVQFGNPRLSKYNNTIACLQYDNKKIFLDASDRYASFDILDCEDKGNMVVIKEGKHEEFSLYNKKASSKVSRITAKLDEDGVLKGSNIYQLNNYYAINFRRSFDTEEKRIEELQSGEDDYSIDSYEINNLKDKEKAICERYSFCTGEDNEQPAVLYLPALLQSSTSENPFKMSTRKFPVDFPFLRNEMVNIVIEIPDNYEVQQLPKSVMSYLQDKSLIFRYNCKQVGNKLSIVSSTRVLKTMFLPSEYESLKNMFDMIIKKYQEQIVLKLKE